MKNAAQAVAFCAVAAVAACGSESSSSAFTQRDSAGIRIAENHAPIENWTLTPDPLVQVGAVEGDSAQLLHEVKGALVTGDGGIVIVNGAAPLLRWFDREGKFLRSAGRTGGGPGEFQSFEGGAANIYSVWPLAADSIATWEHSPRRMQVFDSQGRFVRDVSLELPAQSATLGYPQLVGRLGRHDFIAFHSPHRETVSPGAVWRDSVTYTWWSEDGKYTGNSLRLPGYEYFLTEFNGRKYPGRPPLTRIPMAWADSGRLFYSSGDRFEVAVYGSSGPPIMLIRRAASHRALSDAAIASYIAEQLQDAPPDPAVRRTYQSALEAAPFPDSLPAYRRIRVDRTGALWAQDYDMPGEENVTWQVFDHVGRWLSVVTIPRAWQIQDIGRDYLLVLARNEDDVEVVRKYGLRRGAR